MPLKTLGMEEQRAVPENQKRIELKEALWEGFFTTFFIAVPEKQQNMYQIM
jgi:hypothetical protein